MNTKDKKLILDYLGSQLLMSLGTSDGKGSLWSASIYYAVDDDLNIYFMSSSSSIHGKNIKNNPNVSVSIADSSQTPKMKKVGMQISGKCTHAYNMKDIVKLLKVWNEKLKTLPAPPLSKLKLDSPFYKIVPNKIKIFDQSHKEKERVWDLL